MERRFVPTDIEIRDGEGGGSTINGYAAVFYRADDAGTEYELFDNVRERIDPKAFDRALEERHDVAALFNHDPNHLLGRSTSGTLRLDKNRRGLRYEISLPDTEVGRSVRESVSRGDLNGSSFAFRILGERWETHQDEEIRTITDLELRDVGPVVYPAYKSTTAGLRDEHVAECRDSLKEWLGHKQKEEEELQAEIASREKQYHDDLMKTNLAVRDA